MPMRPGRYLRRPTTMPTPRRRKWKLAAVLGVRWATYERDTDRLYDTVKAALHAPD